MKIDNENTLQNTADFPSRNQRTSTRISTDSIQNENMQVPHCSYGYTMITSEKRLYDLPVNAKRVEASLVLTSPPPPKKKKQTNKQTNKRRKNKTKLCHKLSREKRKGRRYDKRRYSQTTWLIIYNNIWFYLAGESFRRRAIKSLFLSF